MFVIVAGPEVVGPFDSAGEAEEWAGAYIDDACAWLVREATDPHRYERELCAAEEGDPS